VGVQVPLPAPKKVVASMWTLWIISIALVDENNLDLQYRKHKKEFESQWACNNAADDLKDKIKFNETTICYQTTSAKKALPGITY